MDVRAERLAQRGKFMAVLGSVRERENAHPNDTYKDILFTMG